VIPAAGEPADLDGRRPLGALKDLLDQALFSAGLGAQAVLAVRGRFGLGAWPPLSGDRPLGQRVPVERRRRPSGLSDRRLRQIVDGAMRALDESLPARPGSHEVPQRLMPDPALSAWFLDEVAVPERAATLRRAVADAMAFASSAGLPADDRLLDELTTYLATRVEAESTESRNAGTSRARAFVALALWNIVGRRPSLPTILESASSGTQHPPADLILTDEWGDVLSSRPSTDVIARACAEALETQARDREMANVMVDLLLGSLSRNPLLGNSATATILRTAVRVRAADEDPVVFGLVRQLMSHSRASWLTIDALQAAVKVASAFGIFDLADELCNVSLAITDQQFAIPEGTDLRIEQAEHRLWGLHQRTATLRRRFEAGDSLGKLPAALLWADEVERSFAQVLERRMGGAPGRATEAWGYYFAIRRAELRVVAAWTSPVRRGQQAEAAATALVQAEGIAERAGSPASELVPAIKVQLLLAVLRKDLDAVAEGLWGLHRAGWPLRRGVAPIVAIVNGTTPARWPPPLGDLLREIDYLERQPGWKPQVLPRARRPAMNGR
jgi:hypothetical protein